MRRTERKLTAIMFTDVVGYSALVNADEARARELLQMQNRLLRRRLGRHGGRHIDSIGDGNLAIFDSALAAVECAVALQNDLLQRNRSEPADRQLRLRVGLHQGDVERGGGHVFGDGINVCARIEPLAPHGGIAASAMVVAQVHGPLRGSFRSRGLQPLKNIPEPVEVFELPEAALPAAAGHIVPRRRPLRLGWIAALAGLAVLVAAAGAFLRLRPAQEIEASLAILPLENLSTDPGSAEFVAGLHDALLTEVARLPHLRVISRSSVMRYARERPGSPEIGRQLRVEHLLEGSVQRVGDRLRVNVQLIRAASDEHVWAEIFERDMGGIFQMQTDISRAIARKIHGNVVFAALPEAERPSKSIEAYDLYLRALASEETEAGLGLAPPDEPLRLLDRAVQLDPDFALAHAALARFAVWGAHWASSQATAQVAAYVERAAAAAQRAFELAPDKPETLYAMGIAQAWKQRKANAAEPFLLQALAQRPDYAPALYMLSGIHSTLGHSQESIVAVRALLDVDPNNEKAHEQLFLELLRTRRYGEALEAAARWAEVSAAPAYARKHAAQVEFYRSGDLGPWKAVLAQPAGGLDPDTVDFDRWDVALLEGRFGDAAAIRRAAADDFVAGGNSEHVWALAVGQALALGGQPDLARPYLSAVAAHYRRALGIQPEDRQALTGLGDVLGLLGQTQEALQLQRRAMDLAQAKAGQPRSAGYYESLGSYAQTCARAGRRDEALAALETLLREPSNVHAHAVLRDPLWGALSGDPAFKALVRRYLPG